MKGIGNGSVGKDKPPFICIVAKQKLLKLWKQNIF